MNTAIMIIIVLLAVCVTLFGIIYVQHKQLNEENKTNQILEDQIKKLQNNIAFLVKHAKEMAQIEKEKEKTFQRIEEARTDEEISDIVSAIVSLNNQRV